MQSSNYAILQVGNLFAYTMNNPIMWVDPTGMVIELAGNWNQQQTLLSYLQMLTDHRLRITDSRGTVGIYEMAGADSRLSYGNALIYDLINHERKVRISLNNNGINNLTLKSYGAFTHRTIESRAGSGSDSVLLFDPNNTGYTWVYNNGPGGVSSLQSMPAHITLAHELIHAYRGMQGRTLRNDGPNAFSSVSVQKEVEWNFLFLSGTRVTSVTHTFLRDEHQTIGIGVGPGFSGGRVTENAIRREQELPERASHDGRAHR